MDLTGFFQQTLSTAPATGVSAAGLPTFGATISIKGRVEFDTKLIRRQKDGIEAVSSAQIGTQQKIGIEDRVWLPGENSADNTIAHVPLRVSPVVDKTGVILAYTVFLA